jgi:competence protein ComEC
MAGLVEQAAARLTRYVHLVALGALVAGLALSPVAASHGGLPDPEIATTAAVAAFAAVSLVAGSSSALRLALLAVCLAVAGLLVGAVRLEPLERAERKLERTGHYDGTATVLERPRPGPFGSSAQLRLSSGERVLARASGDLRWPAAGEPGLEVRVAGSLARPRSEPAAEFDWAAHLRRRGVAAELRVTRLEATGGRRGGPAGAIDTMRRRAERATALGVGEREAALLRGMVLGQDERIEPTVREDWRAAGLGHLLAVSGQNVMLLGALALPLLALAGLGPAARVGALLALIALYVPLAGAGPSLQRAGVMGAAGLAALALGRPASRWYCLLLAAAATLAVNPLVSGDPGWQLSFAAVVGIITLAPAIRDTLRGAGSGLSRPRPAQMVGARLWAAVSEAVAITVAATLATAPLVAFHFGSLPLAGLAANVAALAAVAPVMWIGMVQTALGQVAAVPELALPADAACAALGRVARWPLAWLGGIATRAAELPGGQLALPIRTPLAVAAAYALLAVAVVAVRLRGRLSESDAEAFVAAWRSRPGVQAVAARWGALPVPARLAAAALAAALLAASAHTALAPPGPPERLTVTFLDVGQGDATLVQHPDGSAVLFDGGPAEGRVARLLRRAGVRRLSAVVATHASADHHGGLQEVLERFPVGLLVDGGDGTRDRDFEAMLAQADTRGVRRVPARAGGLVRAGSLTVRILSPPPRPAGPAPEDPNPRAVVAVVSSGAFDLFLSADAESLSLAPLELPDVEAMKVPHHGSSDPGLPAVLERLRPELAVIEVGENSYGHPAPETLAALDRAVPQVRRTDRDGTVRLTLEAGRMTVDAER